jgi:hypothetical protein
MRVRITLLFCFAICLFLSLVDLSLAMRADIGLDINAQDQGNTISGQPELKSHPIDDLSDDEDGQEKPTIGDYWGKLDGPVLRTIASLIGDYDSLQNTRVAIPPFRRATSVVELEKAIIDELESQVACGLVGPFKERLWTEIVRSQEIHSELSSISLILLEN